MRKSASIYKKRVARLAAEEREVGRKTIRGLKAGGARPVDAATPHS